VKCCGEINIDSSQISSQTDELLVNIDLAPSFAKLFSEMKLL
jgi:hypothetical protein